ncbi:MAG: MBOAT family protein [Clostridiales bacterium]|nr:MBOAT family protein [Clostridiales bacterium]
MLHPLYLCLLVPAACAGFFALGRFRRLRTAWLLLLSAAFLLAVQPDTWWLTLLLAGLAWLAPQMGRRGATAYAVLAVGTLVAVKLTGGAWPVGLSFAALQGISYAVDAVRDASQRGTLCDTLLYALFFPKLSAGPLCRFGDFRRQSRAACVTWDDLEAGLLRLAAGLGKKLLIADSLYPAAMAAFSGPAHPLALLLSLVCCPLYVYFDFSGCTDMALGVGLMLGMRLPENFDRPLRAASVRDFWRRWHLSLSGFLRDYVYIPLGGSRRGQARTLLNLTAVFLLMGVWHGFTWGYLLFGAYHALLMVLERGGVLRPDRWVRPAARLYTLLAVSVGFVIFMSTGIPVLSLSYGALQAALLPLSPGLLLALGAAMVVLLREGAKPLPAWLRRLGALLLLAGAVMHLMAGGYVPMLYAQF